MKSLKADIFSSSSGSTGARSPLRLDLLAVLVEEDAGALEHAFVGEDGHLRADSEGEGIARARVDLHRGAVEVEDDAGVEGVVREVVHEDVVDVRAERLDDGAQEVVGEGAGDGDFLELDGDGVGFGRANPDRQIAVGRLLLEDHDPLVVHQAYPDALDRHLDQPPNLLPSNQSMQAPLRVSKNLLQRHISYVTPVSGGAGRSPVDHFASR